MLAMFGITGAGLSGVRAMQNGGKRARHSVDAWDRQSNLYPQPSRPPCMALTETYAPLGFELNNPWRLEKRFL
ncbi:hypothetical protein DID88_008482 [Monilinia fructigena]|uniref:NADH dehydrogenase [ubiquinone] 1 alpha subcomplex subunit 1 n=1 Tax=Monilinia fructigena TaxID=38457 RepID=A0A395JAL8_9HELO|nr:hypothetical protein DID88_008482 [Monilinia fructigena]